LKHDEQVWKLNGEVGGANNEFRKGDRSLEEGGSKCEGPSIQGAEIAG